MVSIRSHKNLAKVFIKKTEENMESAKILLEGEIYSESSYNSQQCAEKIIKALLVLDNKFVADHQVASHFVKNILVFSEGEWKNKMKKVAEYSLKLEEHWIKPRYPFISKSSVWDPTERYSKEMAENAIKKATFVIETLKLFIKEKYSVGD